LYLDLLSFSVIPYQSTQHHNITTIQLMSVTFYSVNTSKTSKKKVTFFIHVYKCYLFFNKACIYYLTSPLTFITSVITLQHSLQHHQTSVEICRMKVKYTANKV